MLQKPIGPGLGFSENDVSPDKYASNVDIEIGRSCNFSCLYCYLDRDSAINIDPTKNQLFQVIDEVADIKPHNVLFTGGEPFFRKDLFELIEYAVEERDLSVSIFTNGYLINEEKAKSLAHFNVRLCLKMDSLDPSVQDKLTGFIGSANATQRAIVHLKNHGYCRDIPLTIHACINKINFRGLRKLFNWAKENNIAPYASRLVPWGMGKLNFKHLGLSTLELRETYLSLRGDDLIPSPGKLGCIKMYKSCFITSLGDVQPCSNVRVIAGNIYQEDLKEILQKDVFKIARNIRKHIKGTCAKCENNKLCYGCRGLTHAITGDWLAEDPLCWRIEK